MNVQIFTCRRLLLAAVICALLPSQVDGTSKAIKISSSGSNVSFMSADLAVGCSWAFSYSIRGPKQFNRTAINQVLGAFFNRLCGL